MTDKKIKVTDKRLFTADGELRNEYRHLEDEAAPPAAAEPSSSAAAAEPGSAKPEPAAESPVAEPGTPPAADEPRPAARSAAPAEGRDQPSPTFFDLVSVVAQPIALYLGDAKMPDGESMENLELARLYIDLLEVLSEKSTGNLSPDEKGFLDDLLYQLRLRYVEKTG